MKWADRKKAGPDGIRDRIQQLRKVTTESGGGGNSYGNDDRRGALPASENTTSQQFHRETVKSYEPRRCFGSSNGGLAMQRQTGGAERSPASFSARTPVFPPPLTQQQPPRNIGNVAPAVVTTPLQQTRKDPPAPAARVEPKFNPFKSLEGTRSNSTAPLSTSNEQLKTPTVVVQLFAKTTSPVEEPKTAPVKNPFTVKPAAREAILDVHEPLTWKAVEPATGGSAWANVQPRNRATFTVSPASPPPTPTTTPDVQPHPPTPQGVACICKRPPGFVFCLVCGKGFTGRVSKPCPAHPKSLALMDATACRDPDCASSNLVEHAKSG